MSFDQAEEIRYELRQLQRRNPALLTTTQLLNRDCLVYGWWLQRKSRKKEIDFNWLLKCCSTTNEKQLNVAVEFWRGRGFFNDEKYQMGILSFKDSEMELIKQILDEPEFAYFLEEMLPSTNLKTLDFIKYMNQIEKTRIDLADTILNSLTSIFQIGWVPIQTYIPEEELSVCELHSGNTEKVWIGVASAEGTLNLDQLIRLISPLNQAILSGRANYALLVFTSLDDDKNQVSIFNDNPSLFGMTTLTFIRFLHLLNLAKINAEQTNQALKDFTCVFDKNVPTSFDYPADYAVNRII